MRNLVSRPALALGCAAALTTWSLGTPAFAGQGATSSNGDHGRHTGQVRNGATSPAPTQTGASGGKARPTHGQAAAQHHGTAKGTGTSKGTHDAAAPARSTDPSGNNGTIKIDRLGEMDRIPNNVPHPGCTFQVEWFGFDGGSDVLSTVSFTMQAPTRDVGLTVSGPSVVPVGGDAASGAGTATGPDAVQAYTLGFSGPAQAKQGYHVRLTVSTPRSRGNDTKTKVFWVAPCVATATPARGVAGTYAAAPTSGGHASSPAGATSTWLSAPSMAQAVTGPTTGVAAERGAVSADSAAAVPVVIDAGEQGSVLGRWSHSPLSLGLTLAGLLLAVASVALRLRRRA
ncbi:hypothetical protein GCM10009798_37760 [Nocardioides panacihumi]|uniref:Gram-positive cocci surface proteins LPxTG domain-containing protein n=1 Tax=Nocardioides panacihumi TaxID=400774 RepID=A0ABN2RQ66_9ACTN